MLEFAVNITFVFTERPFLERFAAAREAGLRHVEFHNPYPFCEETEAIAAAAAEVGVEIIHFNLPGGDWAAGERGIAIHPHRQGEFREGVERSIEVARRLGCRQLNCPLGYPAPDGDPEEQRQALVANLRHAAKAMEPAGIRLLIEPLNPLTHPGYPLVKTAQAVALLEEVDHPNLRIQYDYYQMQRSEGELAETVRQNLPRIGFIQLADNPGRHQPGTGEINFGFLLADLERLGYSGYVSMEYQPLGDSWTALRWLTEHGQAGQA